MDIEGTMGIVSRQMDYQETKSDMNAEQTAIMGAAQMSSGDPVEMAHDRADQPTRKVAGKWMTLTIFATNFLALLCPAPAFRFCVCALLPWGLSTRPFRPFIPT